MIATTPSQSRRLYECGVDPKTADMRWYKAKAANKEGYSWMLIAENNRIRYNSHEFIPAWSLSALLGLLPKTISDFWMTKWFVPTVDYFQIGDMKNPYQLSGDFQLLHIGGGKYQVEYDWDGFRGKLPQSKNPIEACVLAIELLAANNYKLNQLWQL